MLPRSRVSAGCLLSVSDWYRDALVFTDRCPSPKPKMRLKRRTCEEARNIVTKTGNYGMAGFSQSTQTTLIDFTRIRNIPQ